MDTVITNVEWMNAAVQLPTRSPDLICLVWPIQGIGLDGPKILAVQTTLHLN